MFLLIDIGNTKTKWMLRDQRKIYQEDSFLTEANKESLKMDVRRNQFALSQTNIHPFESVQRIFSNTQNAFMDVYLPRNGSRFSRTNRLLKWSPKTQEILQSDEFKQFFLKELQEADFSIKDYDFRNDELFFIDFRGLKRELSEQSDGTQKYLFLLLDVKLRILDTGGFYIVDELEKALHPLLARRFINLFKNPETNPKNARLLFSSHDMMFLHQSVLNGDQIWFIDRDDQDGTTLYSPAEYADFDPLHVQKDYTLGCYGAVPNTDWRG